MQRMHVRTVVCVVVGDEECVCVCVCTRRLKVFLFVVVAQAGQVIADGANLVRRKKE